MASTKVSELTALTVPDAADLLTIVDVSVSESKKITVANLLAGKSDTGHVHTIANVTGLQTALDGKALHTITVSGGGLISGGGDLSANRTLTLTGATIFTDLLTRDGTGTGLDADLLDGQHASAFLTVSNNLSDLDDAAAARENLDVFAQFEVNTLLNDKADASALTSHTGNTSNPHSVTKTQVGLGNVDNTSDVTKWAASATITNKTISGASNTLSNIAQSSITSLTSDLALKAPLASPTFTGTFTAPSLVTTSTTVGFFGVTPVVRQAAGTDIKDALTSYGLIKGTSASHINLDGGDVFCSAVRHTNFCLGTLHRSAAGAGVTLQAGGVTNVATASNNFLSLIVGDVATLATSGTQTLFNLTGSVNQSSTAGYTGLKVAVTETGTGSGIKYLLNLLGGAAGTTPRFTVNNAGDVIAGGSITSNAVVTAVSFTANSEPGYTGYINYYDVAEARNQYMRFEGGILVQVDV